MSEDNKPVDYKSLGSLSWKKEERTTKSLTQQFKFSKYVIQADNFDLKNFQRILRKNPQLKEMYEKYAEEYEQFPELQQDVYSSLYKYNPKKVPQHLVDSDYILNREVMDVVLDSNKYKQLRELTRLDKVNSAVGSEVLGEKVKEIVEQVKEEHEELLEQMKQAQQQMQQAMQQAQQGEGGGEGEQECESCGGEGCDECDGTGKAQGQGKPGEGEGEEGEGQPAFSLKQAMEIMDDARDELQNKIKKEVGHRIQSALNQATEKTQEVSDYITNWGLGTDPTYAKTGYQNKLKVIDRIKNSSKLKRISKLTGKYRKLATQSKKLRVKKAQTDITDIELGADVSHMIGNEAAFIKHPKTKKYFIYKYIMQRLRQYKLGGEFTLGMGPMVVCIDSSGSMGGDPEIWAKAVALSLLEIAKKQGRNFEAIHFDAGSKDTLHTNTFTKKGDWSVDEAIDLAEYFAGGGTNFEEPLGLAQEKINDDDAFERADIIFITDGQCGIGENWVRKFNQWKEKKHVSVYSVLINSSHASDSTLNLFSDSVTTLSQLKDEDADDVAKGVFQHVQ